MQTNKHVKLEHSGLLAFDYTNEENTYKAVTFDIHNIIKCEVEKKQKTLKNGIKYNEISVNLYNEKGQRIQIEVTAYMV